MNGAHFFSAMVGREGTNDVVKSLNVIRVKGSNKPFDVPVFDDEWYLMKLFVDYRLAFEGSIVVSHNGY